MKLYILMLFFAAVIADAYIYRSVIVTRFRRFCARMVYLFGAVVTDGAALCALMLYGAAADRGTLGVVAVMWLVWLFFLTLVPKLLYTLGGGLDLLGRLVARRRVFVFRPLGLVVAAVAMGFMIHGATAGRLKTRVEHVEICSSRVPEAFDGYRIAQISDLHVGTMASPVKRITRLAEAIAAQKPDMVVFTGDLVNLTHRELTPEVIAALGTITAPDGVWMAWGNHDLGFYIRRGASLTPAENFAALDEKVRQTGWRVLSDASTHIRRGADSILLTGVDYPRDRHLNSHNQSLGGVDVSTVFAAIEGDPFNVVLSHTPRLWNRIVEQGGGDLTLSGHVHAMQTKIGRGPNAWSPARYIYSEWSGRYVMTKCGKNSTLYVNDGIGCVGYPMRIGARGEITLFKLKRCE
jgi:predicted MPP superfamily phosphohydrolase